MAKTRPRGNAIAYLRKSTHRQESSMQMQLEWAIGEAARQGVRLDAGLEDLKHMQEQRLTISKGICLDEGISGAELDRPGLHALLNAVKSDASISHVFVHMADRLARPEFSEDGVAIETAITSHGVTIVFSTRESSPRRRDSQSVVQSIQKIIEYGESGAFLDKLATRIIECQRRLAKQGHWTGGRAPFGFKRVRVFPDGREVDLVDGTSIKSPGSHTELRIADPAKIEIWLSIIEMCHRLGWGSKRIANELNAKDIPSPDAGRWRTENGHRHLVSGRWSPSSVRGLLENTVIMGLLQYGVRSEGRWRRVDPNGPRTLADSDYGSDDKAKTIQNSKDVIIRAPLKGVEPKVSIEDFDACQRVLEERGRNQRGISRCTDPARYPLATRVWDLDCSGPMYGRRSGKRLMYVCSAYMKDQSCNHNNVDAEAMLSLVAGVFRQAVMFYGRDQLALKLKELAESEPKDFVDDPNLRKNEQRVRRDTLKQDLDLISKNLAWAQSEAENEAIRPIFHAKRLELEKAELELSKEAERTRQQACFDPEVEIEAALSVLENLGAVLTDGNARVEFGILMRQLNFNVWLKFAEDRKGQRAVRRLTGGLITTGDAPLPCAPYRKNLSKVTDSNNSGDAFSPPTEPASVSPASNPTLGEDVSYTKVTRGD